MKFLHDNWWPDVDLDRTFIRYISRAPDMDEAIELCKNKGVVIQAGGHCGIWPARLSKIFETVYTFEPDFDNFQCLIRNVKNSNVYAARGVLGDGNPVYLQHNIKNTGGHFVAGHGEIPSYRIDNLNLPSVDLILLDIEGHELFALSGGVETIKKLSPVIMFEDNGNTMKKGGYEPKLIYDFLHSLGYSEKKRIKDDSIWTK